LESLRRQLSQARRPVLVAGPVSRPFESGPELVRLARSLGIPLLADPLSGARVAGAGASYDLLLRLPEVAKRFVPDLILRFGATPSSVTLATWLEAQRDTPHLVVEGGGRWKDHLLVASAVVEGDPARVARALLESSLSCSELDLDWIEGWTRAESMAAQAVEGVLKSEGLAEGMAALEAAEDALRRKGVLFLSNSMPVRDVDTLWPAGASRNGEYGVEAQPLPALGNRGASGIDGIVSTALGVAWGAGTPLTALVGDLALLYDMNGFLARWPEGVGHAATSPGALPPVVFLVVNNRGGGIFHLLPVREHEPAFTPLVATPHEVEPEAIAALHGLPFERVEGRGAPQGMREALRGALKEAGLRSLSSGRPALVELRTDREENRLAHEALRRAVAEAFGGESVG
jgi:2-succinyl-5-enolpyruvyl-6-hydroxy-3-cyclohexene-1-carboxylate synthase